MDVGALVNEQYKIIEHIGRGGMADVWSARDTRLRRMVAIKTIVSGLSNDIDPVELFKREAHTIAQMEHPHILPIYDFGEYDHNLYIVMRYVTGGSLEDLLRDGPMAPDEVLRMGDAIGKALDHAHDNNVIHLDLKPPNILLDSSGAPYLADFGLATVLDPQGRARNPGSGTLLYMAPEQMMSDTIDHRADIYSFCIMLYHMLTGSLPFDGTVPLSMSQVQRDMNLPDLSDVVDHLPQDLSDLLRLGTTQEPRFRPATHMEVMDQFRNIVQPAGVTLGSGMIEDNYTIEDNPYDLMTEFDSDNITDAGLLEAIDIFTRARYDWQGGQGRFLLGVTNFILMSDYYREAAHHNLSIDTPGYQVLLRGAIEYDYELDYWWYKLNDDDRRWVCLHALRSGNTPARIRAMYRLETLPDEQGTAVIPRLVAQALEVETDTRAKLAALQVLATRVQLMKHQNMKIMTQYRGQLINSLTRLGIEVLPEGEWRESAYSEDVDILIAEQAFDPSDEVAEAAARTVGRIRSLTAIRHLSREQQNKRSGALEALAFVRDEAPSLPDVVKRDARFYAWITNTVRRLVENPIQLIANIAIVFIMGWIAMGNHIWGSWGFTVGSLGAQKWTNTVALGVIFGLMMSLTYLLTIVPSQRLQGFWAWWMRLLVSGVLGFGIAILSWTSYRYFFLQEALFEVLWDQMRFAGAALAFGLLASSLLRLKAWQGVLLTTLSTFTVIYATYRGFYFNEQSTIAPIALVAILTGIFCGWRASQLTGYELDFVALKVPLVSALAGILIGVLWGAGIWTYFLTDLINRVGDPAFNWDTVLMLATVNLLLGLVVAYIFKPAGNIGLALGAIGSFAVGYVMYSQQFFDYSYTVPFANPSFEVLYAEGSAMIPSRIQPIIWYRDSELEQIWTLTLPFLFVIALSMHMPEMLRGWWSWIGEPRTPKERGAWMTATLGYVMVITALVSILTLYSPQVNRIWELSWSFWAFVTFVCAMAALRWAKWGANGLLASGILLLVGGIAFDGVALYQSASNGLYPQLLDVVPELSTTFQGISIFEFQIWGVWAGVLALCVWGVQRSYLWGGIGLVGLLVAWYLVVFSTSLQGSVAIFTATNVALVYFALQNRYPLMESSRLDIAWLGIGTERATSQYDTLIQLPGTELQGVPATQIIRQAPDDSTTQSPDPMQTQVPNLDAMRDLETVDFNNVPDKSAYDMQTAAPISIDTEDLRTAIQPDSDFVAFDKAPDNDDAMMTNIKITPEDLDVTEITIEDEEQEPSDSGLTDIKISLDTSTLRQTGEKLPETELKPKKSSGLTDIKINLDTSAIKQDKDPSESVTQPKPVFKFDSDKLTSGTVNLSSNKDDNKEKAPDDKSSSGLTDIKINLDTSAIKKSDEKLPDTEPKPKKSSGLTDIKINLDTSAVRQTGDDARPTTPKPIFKFDASGISNANTVNFDKTEPEEDDDNDDNDE